MRITLIFLSFLFIACSSTKKLTVSLKTYIPSAKYRDGLMLTDYQLEDRNLSFVKTLNVDTFIAYKRTFNDYQSLFNDWQKKEIDSLTYTYRLRMQQSLDSLAKDEGSKLLRNTVIINDTTLDAEVKLLIGINKIKDEIIVIVDENNNNFFGDDRIVRITQKNYKTIFDTLTFRISNLKVIENNIFRNVSLPIMLNQIGNTYDDRTNGFQQILKFTQPWISASTYFKGERKINGQKIYFDFDVFLYNINYSRNTMIVSKKPFDREKLTSVDTLFRGNNFKLKGKTYILDSISPKKATAYISRNETIKSYIHIRSNKSASFIDVSKDDSILSMGGDKRSLSDILLNNNDSLIFIDIWASWCVPCRNEMKDSRKIEQEYKDKKIIFFYISLDTKINDWENASNIEGLANRNNFLLTNSWDAPFIKKYEIQSIPHYMLIKKRGEIMSTVAPRPSDPQLKLLLDKLLKE